MTSLDVREARPGDRDAIMSLYPDAFPEEDLLALLGPLLDETPGVLSLVAEEAGRIAGHAAFTPCRLETGEGAFALLGPLAVAPDRQRAGIGSLLVRQGLARLAGEGVTHVFVLGDPAYYGRFGFTEERGVKPPYPLPEDWRPAWQALAVTPGRAPPSGTLVLPPAWMEKSYWQP